MQWWMEFCERLMLRIFKTSSGTANETHREIVSASWQSSPVANGEVYVATFDQKVVAYRLLS